MVPGAGATELHLAKIIGDYSKTITGLDQYAVEAFGHALEIIPRIIAENAGHKGEAVLADMYAKTAESNKFGIDVSDGKVKDIIENGCISLTS